MTSPTIRIVVADANVLINLMHVARLGLCAELPGLEFMVPDHVREEITVPAQRIELDRALDSGLMQLASITDPGDIGLFADLITRLGRGEAACLVLAAKHGWSVASDEKRRFRGEAVSRIGADRIFGTADLYIRAVRAGRLTIEEADTDKETLEERSFKMEFSSFREVLANLEEDGL